MSNHIHIVATDTHGTLPEFMHWVDEYIAKSVNAHLGRWESFWAPGSYSAVRLVDPDDVLSKMVYVFTNAVDAGLVRRARDWPGSKSLPTDLVGRHVEIQRPKGFFRKNGLVPKKVTLQLDVPDALVEIGGDPEVRLASAVEAREEEVCAARSERGLGVLGRRAVLKQSPFRCPASVEPRRGLSPRIAAPDKWHRIEVAQRLKTFREAYREARERYIGGDFSVRFPWGTYWMRVRLGVQCSGP
jgi:hypothetical protein